MTIRSDHPLTAPSGAPYVYPEGSDFEPIQYGDDAIGDPGDNYEPICWVDPDPGEPEPTDDALGALVEDFTVPPQTEFLGRVVRDTGFYMAGGRGPWHPERTEVLRFRLR